MAIAAALVRDRGGGAVRPLWIVRRVVGRAYLRSTLPARSAAGARTAGGGRAGTPPAARPLTRHLRRGAGVVDRRLGNGCVLLPKRPVEHVAGGRRSAPRPAVGVVRSAVRALLAPGAEPAELSAVRGQRVTPPVTVTVCPATWSNWPVTTLRA